MKLFHEKVFLTTFGIRKHPWYRKYFVELLWKFEDEISELSWMPKFLSYRNPLQIYSKRIDMGFNVKNGVLPVLIENLLWYYNLILISAWFEYSNLSMIIHLLTLFMSKMR